MGGHGSCMCGHGCNLKGKCWSLISSSEILWHKLYNVCAGVAYHLALDPQVSPSCLLQLQWFCGILQLLCHQAQWKPLSPAILIEWVWRFSILIICATFYHFCNQLRAFDICAQIFIRNHFGVFLSFFSSNSLFCSCGIILTFLCIMLVMTADEHRCGAQWFLFEEWYVLLKDGQKFLCWVGFDVIVFT